MFIWERFEPISPKPDEFPIVEMVETVLREVRMEILVQCVQVNRFEMANFKQANNKSLSKAIDIEKNLIFGHTLIIYEEFLHFSFWT